MAANAEEQQNSGQAKRNFLRFVREAQKEPPRPAPFPPRNNTRKRNNRPNQYEALEIPKSATERQIRTAQHRLALKQHPDKGGNDTQFKKIQAAQETLSNSDRKKEQDVAKGFKEANLSNW